MLIIMLFQSSLLVVKIMLHPDTLQLTHNLLHQFSRLDARHILIYPKTHFHDLFIPLADFTPQCRNQHRKDDFIAPALGGVVSPVIILEDFPETDFKQDQPKAVDVEGLDVWAAAKGARMAVQFFDGRVLGDDRHGRVEFRAGGVEAAEVREGDVRDEGGGGDG